MTIFFLSMICGAVMGSATALYVMLITKGLPYKKRIKIIMWVGIPAGCIMGVLAQFIGGFF